MIDKNTYLNLLSSFDSFINKVQEPENRNQAANYIELISNQVIDRRKKELDVTKKVLDILNDSENFSGFESSEEYCKKTLSEEQLKKIIFINGHSVESINKLEDNFSS